MNDALLRAHLKNNLLAIHETESDTEADAVFVDELGLRGGETRVDVALVNGLLHGFEIKSERDTLSRLPQQILSYSLVVDKATLVTTPRHLKAALEILPLWWGVEIASQNDLGEPQFVRLRPSQCNPSVNALHVAELLV